MTSTRAQQLAEHVGAFYTRDDICALLDVTKRTLNRWLAEGKFPEPDIRLNRRVHRWRASTIDRHLNRNRREK